VKSVNFKTKIVLSVDQLGMPYVVTNRNGQVHGDKIINFLDLDWGNGIHILAQPKHTEEVSKTLETI